MPHRLVVEIGRGAFGRVYHIEELRPDGKDLRSKALKLIINPEVRIVAMIESPYVVALLQWGISGAGNKQRFWLTMPLLNGVSLDKVLEEDKKALAEKDVVEIGIAMCNALVAIHEKKILHRDIKAPKELI
ncbi:kinase-like domain-containing protein [Baffinella frigidus]|nr:kinase-like domain-containing protein [Cryptophyta sp. CCMP2293]